MKKSNGPRRAIRFGAFEVDLRAGELRKHGLKIKLQEKPFLVLRTLLEQPGEVVTREELREKLWPADLFIEFEHSLNLAVNKLREALGDSADNPRFVETLTRRGYRFIAPVEGISQLRLPPRTASKFVDSLAVLPFENTSADPNTEYLSDGITESIINSLSQLPKLRVMARSTVFRYKGKQIDPQSIGRELNVCAVLTGRVGQRDDRLTVGTELVDVAHGWHLWGEQYNRNLADIFLVQEEIAREITDKLRLRLKGEEEKRLARHYTENTEAYQLYLKGRYYWNKRTPDGIQKAIEYFQEAILKDPSYALAYAGLADCYHVPANPLPPRERMPQAKAAAMKALELDNTVVEAHTTLARVLFVYDWDWSGAEKEFKRAMELNPRYAPAHQWYASYLSATGRLREADAEAKRAQELEPLSLITNSEVAISFYQARNYDQAIDQFQKTLELDPNFPPPLCFLPAAYEQKGMFEEATAGYQRAITVTKGTFNILAMASLGHVYAVSGRKTEARKILAELQRLSEHSYVPAYVVALIYAGLGEREKAFAWLDKAYEEHSFSLAYIKSEPRFDPLRSDPHFADLLRRIGLPP